MLNINIICVGKLKEKYLKDALNEYIKRLSRYCKLTITELPDEKIPEKLNTNIENVKSNDIEDSSRWGITGTNYTKDITYKNCELNRIDAHSGVHNLTIENSTLGKYGITVVGSEILKLNNVTTLSPSTLVYLRDDYGYDLHLPNITIDGLTINDSNNISAKYPDICIFDNNAARTGADNGDIRNNYILPRNINIKNYQTTSGRKIISTKFYNNLSDLGINLNMPLKDKNEISIKDENDNDVNENTVTNINQREFKQ